MSTVTPPAGVRVQRPAASWRETDVDGKVDAPPGLFPPPADLELLCRVHQGEFTEIWQARDRSSGEFVAWKQWRPDTSQPALARMRLANEAVVLGRIRSPRVVALRGTDLDAPWPALRLEWLAGQSLHDYLQRAAPLTTGETLWIARQCAQGLQALQAAGFLHCDLSTRHVFIEPEGTVKLIDLAMAQRAPVASLNLAGPPCAPDVAALSTNRFEPQIENDIASLAKLMIEMLCGRPIERLLESAGNDTRPPKPLTQRLRTVVPTLPREVADLIQKMLAEQTRPSGAGIAGVIHELVGLELTELPVATD